MEVSYVLFVVSFLRKDVLFPYFYFICFFQAKHNDDIIESEERQSTNSLKQIYNVNSKRKKDAARGELHVHLNII